MARFLTDEPIHTIAGDRLNRSGFAGTLAEQTLAGDVRDCIVIGIHGQYGSGKSSLLNMVEEELTRLGARLSNPPIIVRFNPWNFSTVDQLILVFFGTLSTALGRHDKSAGARAISEKLEQFGDLLAPIGPLTGLPILGALLQAPAAIARIIRKRYKEQTPEEVKRELDRLLETYDRRLVVIIDDIDRLEADKIRLLFRLIRLNADFRNTTYLLAFDRGIAERALTEEGFPGRAYLEKIVQVSYDLPSVEERRVTDVLFEELNETLGSVEESKDAWDSHRWANVYHTGFKTFFRTVRDVKRYVNAVRLNYAGPIREEVNPIDFLVLEALRVFCPDSYRLIPKRKDILTRTDFGISRDQSKEGNKAAIDSLIMAAEEYSDVVRELLLELFPPIASVYGNTSYPSTWQANWRRARRVCAVDVFDKYFLFAVPSNELPDLVVRQGVALAGDRSGLARLLTDLNKEGLARRLLERFEDYTGKIPLERIPGTVCSVVDFGDELSRERRGFFDFGAEVQAMRVVFQLLQRVSNEEERLRIAKEGIETGNSVHFAVHLAAFLQHTEEGKRRGREPILSEEGQREVLKLALTRIRQAASDGTLHRGPHLAYTLFRWREWSGEEETKSYVEQLISSDEGLLILLNSFLQQHQSHVSGEHVSRTTWVIDRNSIGKLLDVAQLVEKAQRISKELDPSEKRAIDALLKPHEEEDDYSPAK